MKHLYKPNSNLYHLCYTLLRFFSPNSILKRDIYSEEIELINSLALSETYFPLIVSKQLIKISKLIIERNFLL